MSVAYKQWRKEWDARRRELYQARLMAKKDGDPVAIAAADDELKKHETRKWA